MYIYDMKKRSMQEPTFLILTALAAGPQHGYAIIADAERISGGVTRLQPGTLYMALDRLRSAGLVEPDREEVADGRLRRYYRLTDDGAAALGGAAERGRGRARPPGRTVTCPRGTRPGPPPWNDATGACCAATRPATARCTGRRCSA